MKAILKILIVLILFPNFNLNAQEIIWQKSFGGSGEEFIPYIEKTADGGYICGSYSDSNISGDKTENCRGLTDYWIIKFDSIGNIQWQKTIGGNMSDHLNSVLQTSDGGYLCGGHSSSNISGDKTENLIGNSDLWIIKLDSLGNIQWQNSIGASSNNTLNTMKVTPDNGCILGATSNSPLSGDKTEPSQGLEDYWVIKLDSLGNIQWQNTIGGSKSDFLFSIDLTQDGGYICGGQSNSGVSGDKNQGKKGPVAYWVVKLDSIGNKQWQKTIGGSGSDHLRSIQQTQDGGYICGGFSNSNISLDKSEDGFGVTDYWIVKLNSTGGIEWQKTIGGSWYDDFTSIIQTIDGGYACIGTSQSPVSGNKNEKGFGSPNIFIVRLDSTGKIIWQNTIGGSISERASNILEINNGEFITISQSNSGKSGDISEYSNGGADIWIFKLIERYNLVTGNIYADLNSNGLLNPNEPFISEQVITETTNGRFTFTNANGDYFLTVLDSGIYSVRPINYSQSFNSIPFLQNAQFNGLHQIDSLNDFAFLPTGTYDDLCMTITPFGAFRPGFNGNYMLNYKNVGTTLQNPSIVFRLFQNASFVAASITPTAIYPDSVVWNLPSLSPFQTGQILVTINLSPSIPIGTILNSYAQIFPIINDVNPSCNNATWEVTVTGSIDPNDILVDQNIIYSTSFPNPPYLDYIIRFQNTGTDTAFAVKILNSIDTVKLDLNTIEFIAASHPVDLRFIYHERNMEFLFNNIFLPDSNVNENASHGFVRYRIKPKSNLTVGDTVKNYAAIYFDFNVPVLTNIALTKIVFPTGIPSIPKQSELFVYPNPTSNEINLEISNSKGKNFTIDLYNIYGQKIKSLFQGNSNTPELKMRFEIGDLQQGMYLLEYRLDGISRSKKIIKS